MQESRTIMTYKLLRYTLVGGDHFEPVVFDAARSYPHIRNVMSLGVDAKVHTARRAYFGPNSIEVPIPPAWKILKDEARAV